MYLSGANSAEPIHRIEDDIATTKAQLAEIKQVLQNRDGGSTTPGPSLSSSHTHRQDAHGTHTAETPTSTETGVGTDVEHDADDSDDSDDSTVDKPHPKSSRSAKVRYIWSTEIPDDPIKAPPQAFVAWINQPYDFGERTERRLIRAVFDRYNAKATKADRPGESFDVVCGSTPDDVDDRIQQYADDVDDRPVCLLQQDGEHVVGADVADALIF
jgi:hypothetical protein